MRVFSTQRLKKESTRMISGTTGMSVDHSKEIVKCNSSSLMTMREERLSGIHLLIFSDRHSRMNTECNFVMDLQRKLDSSTTPTQEQTSSTRRIIHQLRRQPKRLLNPSRISPDWCSPRTKLSVFSASTHSRFL